MNMSSFPTKRLAEVASKIQDGTHFSPRLGGGKFKYITSKNIGFGSLRLRSVERISREEHEKIYRRADTRFGDVLLTKDGANTGNSALNTFNEEISLLSSVAFIRANPKLSSETFILQYLLSGDGQRQIADAMAGNAITRLTLAKIKDLMVPVPDLSEQRRIGTILADVDSLVASLERLITKKRAIKQGMMQELLTGRTRLPGFAGRWHLKKFADLLSYQQPGQFLVSSTDYVDTGIPVLTAGKTFVLGHTTETIGIYNSLPVIIFDDFTTESKYVDFPFKAKSSAMKILSAKPGVDLRFAFERMQLVDYAAVDRKLRWIGEYSKLEVDGPPIEEQRAIARVAADADAAIILLECRLGATRAIKQGMMQELLTGRTRLVPTGTSA